MKTIYIKAYKVVNTKCVGSSRTSNGWLFDRTEYTSCEIWSSTPFDFDGNDDKYSRYFNKKFSTHRSKKDLYGYEHWGDNYTVFSAEWTEQVCEILDFELYGQDFEFKADISDENNNCHFKLSFEYDFAKKQFLSKFTGRDISKDFGETPKAYSPFNTLEELKYGIAALHVFEHEIPNNWISFLIVNSTEDLSSYFRSLNFDLTYKNIIMFNSEGHFYESIKNYEKIPKLEKSYHDAYLNKDERTISWYVWRGASRSYIPRPVQSKPYNTEPDYLDYDNYDDRQNELKAELDSWDDGWQCNID